MERLGLFLLLGGLVLWWQSQQQAAANVSLPSATPDNGYGISFPQGYSYTAPGYVNASPYYADPNGTGINYYGNYYSTSGVQDVIGSDADILARTIYGEARGESDAGKQAVAAVVMNRAAAGWYGGTVAGNCKAPNQFSCWNSNDPNLAVIEAVQAGNPVFDDCLSVAQLAVAGQLPDNTGGALYYHDTSIATPASWSNLTQTVQIGRLIFFA